MNEINVRAYCFQWAGRGKYIADELKIESLFRSLQNNWFFCDNETKY